MSWKFNPPPGWPVPSGDWLPPRDWEPDPDWPPAPPGWEFWVRVDAPPAAEPAFPARGGRRWRVRPGLVAVGAVIALLATVTTAPPLASRLNDPGRPVPLPAPEVPPVGARPSPEDPRGEAVSRHALHTTAVAEVDGRPVAIVRADGRGHPVRNLQVIDLGTGEPLRQLEVPVHVPVVAAGGPAGSPLAVTIHGAYGQDEVLQVWDLATGRRLHQLAGHTGTITALAIGELAGAPIAVSASNETRDGAMRMWDLSTGEQVGEPFGELEHYGDGRSLIVAELTGDPVVVVSRRGGFEVWHLSADSEPSLDRFFDNPEASPAYSPRVAVGRLDGIDVAVATDYAQTVVWDLATGDQIGSLALEAGYVDVARTVAVTKLDGEPTAVVAYADHSIRVWDLTTERQVREPFTGHTDGITALAVTELDGEPVAVSAGLDGNLFVWQLTTR